MKTREEIEQEYTFLASATYPSEMLELESIAVRNALLWVRFGTVQAPRELLHAEKPKP
jgi:hypothetical protein